VKSAGPVAFASEKAHFRRQKLICFGENPCQMSRKAADKGTFFFLEASRFKGLERIFLPTPDLELLSASERSRTNSVAPGDLEKIAQRFCFVKSLSG
jgi:hypothetical protein